MKPIKTSSPISGFWDSRQGGRAENQDACGFLDTDKGLILVVCDGMGGGPAGQLASTTAVQKAVEYIVNTSADIPHTEMVRNAIEFAHQSILAITNEKPTLRGMGSTIAMILIDEQSAVIGHVGDSRVYQFRRGQKIFRTADHSLVADLVRNGSLTEEQARLSSQSNIITKALGGKMDNLADVTERPYEEGDRFVLCTDGIWGMMPEKELIHRMAKTKSLAGAVDSVVLEVEEKGRNSGNSHDNLTIALFETKHNSILKEKMSKKTFRILLAMAVVCIASLIINITLVSKLNTPNPYKKKVEELEAVIAQKNNTISNLEKEVVNQKKNVADEKLKVAQEKEKAADKAREEADRRAKEAREALEKANEAAKKTQKLSSVVKTKVNKVVDVLTQAKNRKEDKERKRLRSVAVAELKLLVEHDPTHKDIYNNVIEKLGNSIATSNSNQAKGHYDILINKLKNIQ